MLVLESGKDMKKRINPRDISVIIPLYNGEITIKRVLSSILHQTYVNYIKEVIVVNDGSTDNSKRIVESIAEGSLIKIVLINTTNGGVSHARNVGMTNATGKWIALCDADDVWFADKLEHQVHLINQNEDIDFIGGNHIEEEQKYKLKTIKGLRKFTVTDLCIKTLPQTSTAVFKRNIFEEIGGYDEKQRYAEDGNFFMKIAANYNYYYDAKQVVTYGDGKKGFGDVGLSANIAKMHEGIVKNLKEMKSLGYISTVYYCFSMIVEKIKYIRRIMIVKLRNS